MLNLHCYSEVGAEAMPADMRELLQVLRAELQFLEGGGYRKIALASWRPPFIFEDSPSCPHSDAPPRRRPCLACSLMQLVPANRRLEQAPCRHIPLNDEGETLDSLYSTGTDDEVEAAVVKWLRAEIRVLEKAREN
jgi:hypothetical protein